MNMPDKVRKAMAQDPQRIHTGRLPIGRLLPLRCWTFGGHCWHVRKGQYHVVDDGQDLVVDYDQDWLVAECRHCGRTLAARRTESAPLQPLG